LQIFSHDWWLKWDTHFRGEENFHLAMLFLPRKNGTALGNDIPAGTGNRRRKQL
jgi:hypothetical protein